MLDHYAFIFRFTHSIDTIVQLTGTSKEEVSLKFLHLYLNNEIDEVNANTMGEILMEHMTNNGCRTSLRLRTDPECLCYYLNKKGLKDDIIKKKNIGDVLEVMFRVTCEEL